MLEKQCKTCDGAWHNEITWEIVITSDAGNKAIICSNWNVHIKLIPNFLNVNIYWFVYIHDILA